MSKPVVSAVEIDHKLHEDFRRRVAEYGVQEQSIDPVLSVLFRTFAHRIETLYAETGTIRVTLLDELISGLGLARRSARPAQTVLRFTTQGATELLEAGTPLTGLTDSGESLTFRTDASITVSRATVSLAVVYENGNLQLVAPTSLEEKIQAARPALDSVRVALGPNPAFYLAFDNLPAGHLGSHSVFLDISPDGKYLQEALEWEPWCLLGPNGEVSGPGLLRPTAGIGGVRQLRWLSSAPEKSTAPGALPIEWGFYGSRVFVFPEVPAERRFVSVMPSQLEPAFLKIFGRNTAQVFDRPRAWIRISLPKEVTGTQRLLSGIIPNAITASNVDCLNETIYFEKHGTAIPVSNQTGSIRHLLAPLSIVGESGKPYSGDMEPDLDPMAGRYAIRNGRVDLHPGVLPNGAAEQYANVRLWTTAGALGNSVGPGRTQSFQSNASARRLSVLNPTSAAGGTDHEGFDQARLRFHGALLSRDRAVTREDLFSSVRAFDRRIREVAVETVARRTPQGLRRIQLITIALSQEDFSVPEEEAQYLRRELGASLKAKVVYGVELDVRSHWV